MFFSKRKKRLEQEEDWKEQELYRQYKMLMWKKAYEILKNPHEAEEATQEACVKVFQHISGIEDVHSSKTRNFLMTIVRNTALDMWRHKGKEELIFEQGEYEGESREPLPADVLITKETYALMQKLIKEKGLIYYDVFLLKVENHLSEQQIAEVLGISYEAVRSRMHRIRKDILEALKGGKI